MGLEDSSQKSGVLRPKKAFDTVDLNQILEVLYSIGFRGPIHEFLISYLLSRSQRVRIKGKVTKLKPILFGVPPISVLGPLLFIIYVNEITRASSQLDSFKTILYLFKTILLTK